ncbi:MAG: aspartate carbamoyltransferase regulatory subunit, partial [Proteiniphilum sp.]|nr:aspartate carbamoyltransferase regulatory subunit [Proteiniphilum sp.]
IGNNLKSSKMGAKGIIKVSDKYFREDEINRIALVAPNVNLNIIKNFDIIEKKKVILPDEIIEIVKCNNPKCISNNEPMKTRFHVIDKERVELQCHYCELKIRKEEVVLI